MRKLFILLLAVTLFWACKNKGKINSSTTHQPKTNNELRSGDDSDENKKRNDTSYHGGWATDLADEFIKNCTKDVIKGGIPAKQAQAYCSCMQTKIERLYPNPDEAAKITEEDMKSAEMSRLVEECLKQ